MKKIISTSDEPEVLAEDGLDSEGTLLPDAAETLDWRVGLDQHDLRLDKALALWVPACSRSYLAQLIEQEAASINGRTVVKPSVKLRAGEQVRLLMRPAPAHQAFAPQDVAFETVYVDDHIRVIHKRAGLVVHPGAGNWDGTLLNGLLFHDPLAAELPRAGIVHRLDKDTSGLMVVARTRQAMGNLVEQMANREIERLYVALVQGQWKHAQQRTVDGWMGRDPKVRTRMAMWQHESMGLRYSRTHIWRLDGHALAALVGCKLDTGRTHQVRVHLAHLKHPLVADAVYGGSQAWGLERQALHACQLSLRHPISQKRITWTADMPEDMQQAIAECGLQYNAAWTSELIHP